MSGTSDMDVLRLYKLTSSAKTQTRRELPFDKYLDQADAKPKGGFTMELNDFERALFRYIAGVRGKGESMRSVMRALAREAALREIMNPADRKAG